MKPQNARRSTAARVIVVVVAASAVGVAVAQGWKQRRTNGRAFPRPLGRRPLCARVGARWRSVNAGTPLVDRAAPPVSRDQSLPRLRSGETCRRRLRRRRERERDLKEIENKTRFSAHRDECNGHCAARGVEGGPPVRLASSRSAVNRARIDARVRTNEQTNERKKTGGIRSSISRESLVVNGRRCILV